MDLITIVIIAVTVLVSLKGFNDLAFFNRFKFQPLAISKGKQYDRLLSSGFLHVDMTHLIFNMLTLFFFANVVIQFCADIFGHKPTGSVVFAIIYILAIIGGNLLALFFHKNNPHYSAVGASGGVSGILFASIVIYPDMQLYLFFALPIKAWIFAILYLGYSVYGMRTQLGNIGHEAHLGGAIVGMAAPLILAPYLFEQNMMYILGMMVPLVILLVTAIKSRK